jgi:hypothetical protein
MSHNPSVANGISACLIARSNRAQKILRTWFWKPRTTPSTAEFDEATETSLARLRLSRLLPDLRVAQSDDPATLVGPDIVLYFDDHKAVLIRADKKARRMIGERVQHGYTPRPLQEGDDTEDTASEG